MKPQRRILLVDPPYFRLYGDTYGQYKYSLSLGYLAGTIQEETDWQAIVYNADYSTDSKPFTYTSLCKKFDDYRRNLGDLSFRVWREVETVLREYEPAVVGISCCAPNSRSVGLTAKLAKEVNKTVTVVVGGPHPTAIGSEILLDANIDVVVKGEGERTIVELLDALAKKESLSAVRGIIYKEGNEIVGTENRKPIGDLDSLCFPHRHAREVLKDYDKLPKSAFSNVLATRGCPYNCFFCGTHSVMRGKVRFRSVQNVTDEIRSLKTMGLKWIDFLDDTFTVDRAYTHELCSSLAQDCRGIMWSCQTRANLVDAETVALMKKAGCRAIYIGVESGNNEILTRMRKGITLEEAARAIEVIRNHRIRVRANFLIGTPWETEETLNDTLMAMRRLKAEFSYSIFTPYPGTEAFEYCRRSGLIDAGYDVALHSHQSPENFFCASMQKERFRELAAGVEEYVERRDSEGKLRRVLSPGFPALYEIPGAFRSRKSFVNLMRAAVAFLGWSS